MKSPKYTLPIWLLLAIAPTGFAQQQSLPQLIRRIKPAVVAIITYDSRREKLALGSGFFIAPNRLITNRHVIEDASSAEIKTFNGRTYRIQGIAAIDDEGDLVMLQVSIPSTIRMSPLQISKSKPAEGERIFVIGNPLGLEGTISDGLVSSVREMAGFGTIIQITAPISPGSSGSSVINLRGQVIGVATSQLSRGQNLNFAMPSSRIAAMRPSQTKTLAEFVTETASTHLAQAKRLVLRGKTILWATWKFRPDGSFTIEPAEGKRASEEVIPLFTQATQIAPDYPDAWSYLGDAYETLDKDSEAVDAYEHAIRLCASARDCGPSGVELTALMNVAVVYKKLKRYEAAIDAYQKVIRIYRWPSAALYMGEIYDEEMKRSDRAIESYQEALQLKPDFYEAHEKLAWVYLVSHDYRAAIEHGLQAVRIKPDYFGGHYVLGLAYLSSGNRSAALEEYKILKPLNSRLADHLFKAIYKE
ncbi:MAG: trypsin-like peptidase domain-containing protein [Pyrinomonadaceae bacterium]